MILLDLLPELMSKIFETIVISVDLDIALYLRRVCRRFDDEIIQAICNTRKLESLIHGTPKNYSLPWKNERLYTQYMITRTQHDRFHKEPYSKMMEETLDYITTLLPHHSSRRDEYFHALCQCTAKSHWRNLARVLDPPDWGPTGTLMDHVLAAICYLELRSLVPSCLEAGAENGRTFFGVPLDIAAAKGDSESSCLLFHKDPIKADRANAICIAAGNGHIKTVEMISQTYVSLNTTKSINGYWQGYYPILQSARAGQIKACQYFITNISSVASLEDRLSEYIPYRYYQKRPERFSEYLKRPVIAYWYDVALYEGCKGGQLELVKWALENGADPNIKKTRSTMRDGCALECAAACGSHTIMKLLLERGARLNPQSYYGNRTFARAIRESYLSVVQIMVEGGFDLNKNHGGLLQTCPELITAKRGHIEMLELVLKLGLKVNIFQGVGQEAYEYAASHGYSSIIRILESNAPKATLLSLPIELFSRVIEYIVSADLDIALSLRIISKRFDEEIMAAVVRIGALEPQPGKTFLYSSTPFLSIYLFRRTLADPLRNYPHSKAMGSALDYIISRRPEDENRREEYLRKLCHATIRLGERDINSRHIVPRTHILGRYFYDHPPMEVVMAAAAILDLRVLFRECVDMGIRDRPTFLGEPSKLVASNGDLKSIEKLVQRDIDNGGDPSNILIKAVKGAATQRDPAILQSLFDMWTIKPPLTISGRLSNPDWIDFRKLIPLSVAAGQLETIKYLVTKLCLTAPFEERSKRMGGAACFPNGPGSPDVYWYNYVLWEAALRGKKDIVDWTIENGAEVNSTELHHWPVNGSVLDSAARSGSFQLVDMLIRRGATTSSGPKGLGVIPFSQAVGQGWLDIVRTYVGMGYDPNVEIEPQIDFRGGFPVIIAVKRGKVACVELLIELGLRVDIREGPGKEAYDHAILKGYTTIARLLEECSAVSSATSF